MEVENVNQIDTYMYIKLYIHFTLEEINLESTDRQTQGRWRGG